jgi:hypothetical protein
MMDSTQERITTGRAIGDVAAGATTLTDAEREKLFASDGPNAAQRSAVINPYALAELITGRRIAWRQVENAPRLLEDILQTPYEELFDPKYGGPLYTGLRLDEKMNLVQERSPLLDIEVAVDVNDLDLPFELDNLDIKRLGDLAGRFDVKDVGTIEVQRAQIVGRNNLQLTVRLVDSDRLTRLARVITKEIVMTISPDLRRIVADGWTPPGGSWADQGRFFNEAAEFFDPIQGAVANCYYIAALSAVAWAMPYRISHMTRATGQNQEQFTNLIRFYKPDVIGQIDKEIEVTDRTPVSSGGNPIYCRSSEAGEIWPAVYEKAFAKFVTGTNSDHPDITQTAWGDCVLATAQLIGARRFYYNSSNYSASQIWDLVRGNSMSKRTFNPMTAWTYSSGDASDQKIVYADANIVASHCYTILGWEYRNGTKYIILRNPWGNTEASVQTLNGTVVLHDVSWWRPIDLTAVDGVFAIEASGFKKYFAGLGVAK